MAAYSPIPETTTPSIWLHQARAFLDASRKAPSSDRGRMRWMFWPEAITSSDVVTSSMKAMRRFFGSCRAYARTITPRSSNSGDGGGSSLCGEPFSTADMPQLFGSEHYPDVNNGQAWQRYRLLGDSVAEGG